MRRREQHCRRLGSMQARKQSFFGRLVPETELSILADVSVDRPLECAGGPRDAIGERIHEQGSAQIGGGIAEMTRSPVGNLLPIRDGTATLVGHDRAPGTP